MAWETYVHSEEVPFGHPACGRWGVDESTDYRAMREALNAQLGDEELLQNMKRFTVDVHHRHTPDSGWRITFERYEDD